MSKSQQSNKAAKIYKRGGEIFEEKSSFTINVILFCNTSGLLATKLP